MMLPSVTTWWPQMARAIDNWLWGSQILIQNSSNVKVYRNLVEIAADFGNGIGVIYQDRREEAHGAVACGQ